jgi:transposase
LGDDVGGNRGVLAAADAPVPFRTPTRRRPLRTPGATAVKTPEEPDPVTPLGHRAAAQGRNLHSYRIGLLPVLNRILERLRLEEFFLAYLPPQDRRCRIDPAAGLLVLLKNLLLSREPLYGVGEWAARHAPDLIGLSERQLASLNDDRIGRCLDRLFQNDCGSLALAVATHAIAEFGVELDQLHNDSTTITFHGDYPDATHEERRKQQLRLAITWGHNKDHRPDLKQLLFILTVSNDGGIPVYFQAKSGNVADDQTHRATWDLLCTLAKRRDFLYVADCKLATAENMAHVHQHGGRFLTTIPRTRSEDRAFRDSLLRGLVRWRPIHEKRDEKGEVVDRYSISEAPATSAEGYRLVWYHSTRKAESDAATRARQVDRALQDLAELKRKLVSPRTRYRDRAKVDAAVVAILEERGASRWITTTVEEQPREKYHQEGPGRPSEKTRYLKEVSLRFDLKCELNHAALAAEGLGDGVFPLITNDRVLSEEKLLLAYKGQPAIEKRFSQLKTDFAVAPVYLKEVSRIQSLLCMYFFVLLAESLLERELRQAMARAKVESLRLYPEGRACRRPTVHRLIEVFEEIQRHELQDGTGPAVVFTTKLSRVQRTVLRLLEIPSSAYDA